LLKINRRKSLALAAVFFLSTLSAWAVPQASAATTAERGTARAAHGVRVVHVVRVLDGDSLRLDSGADVRLIGIDSPEFSDQKRNDENARRMGMEPKVYAGFAEKARRRMRELVASGEIRLEFDPSNTEIGHKDKYGRLLAYVWVGEICVNAKMIEEGYAAAYGRFPHARRSEYYALQKEAKARRAGFWAHLRSDSKKKKS